MNRFWLVLLLCAALGPVQAEVFKWIDAEGKVQYGDVPPKGIEAKKVSGGVTVMPAFVPPAKASKAGESDAARAPTQGTGDRELKKREESSASSPSGAASSLPAREEMRRNMIAACERNRGVDCEESVDAQLAGQPATVYVPIPVPGWNQPAIQPRSKSLHSAAHSSSQSSERNSEGGKMSKIKGDRQ
jgi:hypothetical protein